MIIRAGEYEILHSGTVLSFKDEPISFELAENMIVRLLFKTDPSKSNYILSAGAYNGSQLDIDLINFDNPAGASPREPINLGHLNGQVLYLNFSVYTIMSYHEGSKPILNARTLHYTWYTRELVRNPSNQ
jgi:hypothetical protein